LHQHGVYIGMVLNARLRKIKVLDSYTLKGISPGPYIKVEEIELTVNKKIYVFTRVCVVGKWFKAREFEDTTKGCIALRNHLIKLEVKLGI